MRDYRPVADRRRQLVEAALTVAERDGVTAATVRAVAGAAGVSAGLVSYCFGTKEELILAMATQIVQDLNDHVRPELPGPADDGRRTSDPDQPLAAVLRKALAGLWRHIELTPGRQLLTYEITTLSLRDPSLSDLARRQYAVIRDLTTQILVQTAAAADVTWSRDVDEIAALVVMAIDGATLSWLVDRDSTAALARLGDIADLISTMTARIPIMPAAER